MTKRKDFFKLAQKSQLKIDIPKEALSQIVYCCGTAWGWEMGHTDVTVYNTVKHLKTAHKCTNDCGVVQLEVKFIKNVKKAKPIAKWKKVKMQ